jgi:uncharacterized protein YdhG (YjbR/CyaY superfamily)
VTRKATQSVHLQYISQFPAEVRRKLIQMRALIRKEVPEVEEVIAYGVAAFRLAGSPLVYIAGFKKHVSFFPTSSGIRAFREELSGLKTSTGTVQFSLEQPLPLALLREMVRFRVRELNKNQKSVGRKCDTQTVANFDYSRLHEDLRVLPKPAQRALIHAGLLDPKKISKKTEEELLSLHGFGPSSLPMLRSILKNYTQELKSKRARLK